MKKCVLLACVLAVLACPASAVDKRLTIAVIPKGTTHEFWKSIHAGALKGGEEMGVDILWKGPLREDDREEQIKVVEDMIVRGVDGIVLAPLDDTALRGPVRSAVRSDIPVVIIDSGLKSDQYTSFVATDNFVGGQMGGKHLANVIGGQGRVVMLRYQEGSASTKNREEGFLSAIRDFPGITVVSASQYAGATTESAYKASENLLAPLKVDGTLTIDGVFCPNESSAFGMLRALQDGGQAGHVHFVGFDASTKLLEGLRAGEIDGLIVQNPFRMGYLGVKTIVMHLRGEPVVKRVDTGVALVTNENLNDPVIQEVIAPDLNRWLR
ncbi:MAG: substrate-binding domain-containing protein [Verrucomicrobia bacterium]|nr:substrate-binding domain-containing protein [Verrucomicrobiota bacterium]